MSLQTAIELISQALKSRLCVYLWQKSDAIFHTLCVWFIASQLADYYLVLCHPACSVALNQIHMFGSL